MSVKQIHQAGHLPIRIISNQASPPKKISNGIWDVTLIDRSESRQEDITDQPNYFETGLAIHIPEGHVLEVHASPSMIERGYYVFGGTLTLLPMDVNDGLLKIPMVKLTDVTDLDLPCDGVRLVTKKVEPLLMVIDTQRKGARSRNSDDNFVPTPVYSSSLSSKDKKSNKKSAFH